MEKLFNFFSFHKKQRRKYSIVIWSFKKKLLGETIDFNGVYSFYITFGI